MTNRTTTVTLTANIAQYLAALRTAGAATASFAASGTKLATQVGVVNAKMAGLATGIGFVAATGITTMAQFERAMSLVQATTEATASGMLELREAALAVAGETMFTPAQAAEGITILSKAGVEARDILAGGLTGAMNLAAAGEMEVAEAGQIAASALNTFRLEGEQMPHVADLLASTANEAQGEVHDLGFALRMTAAVAAQTGLTIEETMASLGAMANRGLINSDAGTSLKSFLIHLVPTTDTAAAAMERIGLAAFNAQGEFIGMKAVAEQLQQGLADLSEEQQLVELRTIFGTDAIRAASVMYAEGAEGIQKWLDANRDGYAAQFAETINDNLIGDVMKLRGELEALFIGAGQGANGPLRELAQSLTEVLGAVNALQAATSQGGAPGLFGSAMDVGRWGIDALKNPPKLWGDEGSGAIFEKKRTAEQVLADSWVPQFGREMERFRASQEEAAAASQDLLAVIASQRVETDAASLSASGLANAANAAADAARELGNSASGAAGGVADLDAQMRGAIDGAMGYIDAMQGFQSSSRDILSFPDMVAESGSYTISGGSGGSGASKAATKARNERIKKMREADQKEVEAEIKAAREKARKRAEARADAQARADVQKGVKEFIDTDKKAKAGENIDGFNNTNEVGEYRGQLTEKEQKKLEKEIEGIRARHKKALDAQIKALRAAQGAASGTASATKGYTTSLDRNTEAGRKNWETVDKMVDVVQQNVKDAYASTLLQTGSVEKAGDAARDAMESGYDAILDAVDAYGWATDEVEAYLGKLGMIESMFPMLWKIKVDVDDSELTDLEERWKILERNQREKDKELRTPPKEDPKKPAKPAQPPIGTQPRTTTPPYSGYPATNTGRAMGGPVYGPGSSTSDSIPMNLSNGEYVVRASQYAMNRDLVQAINNGTGKIPLGGSVGVLIEGGVNVTAPSPVKAGESVIDELSMLAYRKAVR